MLQSMANREKTVWILGSGFSKSLGGPLLNELLTTDSEQKSKARYPSVPHATAPYRVYWQHNPAYPKPESPMWDKPPDFWTNAEEFLGFMDAVRSPGYRQTLFKEKHVDNDLRQLHRECIQAIAMECLFIDQAPDMDEEVWQPYIGWAEQLTNDDAIITFNYDLVLESLAALRLPCGLGSDSVLLPTERPSTAVTNVFKLHGSVDWTREGPAGDDVPRRELPLKIISDNLVPLVAAPGPEKRQHANGLLSKLWEGALEAIRDADMIVFVGYRFPPSDSEARRRILGAIREGKRQRLAVYTALGPRTSEDDSIRLQALLDATLSRRRGTMGGFNYMLKALPLYAQDFLTVFHRGMLSG